MAYCKTSKNKGHYLELYDFCPKYNFNFNQKYERYFN